MPGNHDVVNAIGYYKPMNPPTDASAMAGIYNLMFRPQTPKTAENYEYATDRIDLAVRRFGIGFFFVNIWPGATQQEWMDAQLKKWPAGTPALIFAHDPPGVGKTHLTNPTPAHESNETDKYENLIADMPASDGSTAGVQSRFARFVADRPAIRAYFHGHSNHNQFYEYVDTATSLRLPTVRIDSPMKGRYSSQDQRMLSFVVVSIDPLAGRMTTRECFWARKSGQLEWGASKTIDLHRPDHRLPVLPAENLNFMVASDMGRSVASEQQTIADLMGLQAEKSRMDFIAVAGDPIHDDGVESVTDEAWKRKFENIYTAESLQELPFYVVSGNHEYCGNVQAILDYSQLSKRWNAPQRYYSVQYPIGTGRQNALLVYLDTAPLIDRLRMGDDYSDAGEQSVERQLRWLDSTLVASNDRWKIVIGHHPVYADTDKAQSERTDMQNRVGRILESRGADFYLCGHIHNFQYIRPQNSRVHYVVNSSASLSREVHPVEGTVFCNSDPGYSAFTVSADSIRFFFVNHTGETVYDHTVGGSRL